MIEVDGSIGSGSGTVLRLSLFLSALLNEKLYIFNIRAKRRPPGLKPQHLKAVLAVARICNAEIKGAFIGSRELYFEPNGVRGGNFTIEIGTAGSIPMVILTLLPISVLADKPVEINIVKGGTDVHFSPTINYIRFVLLHVLRKFNINALVKVLKYGYYPKGMGYVTLKVFPSNRIKPVLLDSRGMLDRIGGISVCTYLKDRRVAERQAKSALNLLKVEGIDVDVDINVVYDFSNPLQKGSSITLWADFSKGCRVGSDAIGALRKPSEVVGSEVARKLLAELEVNSTVDVHLADMLIPYMALAKGYSCFLVRSITEHLSTNMRLMRMFLDVNFRVSKVDNVFKVECY